MVTPAAGIDPELATALDAARGSWAILRKGRRHVPPSVRRFRHSIGEEANARAAWAKLAVSLREGWALLVNPEGQVVARQSGPWGVRKRW